MRHATYVWPLCLLMNHPRLIVEVIMSLVAEHRMQITATTWRCSTDIPMSCIVHYRYVSFWKRELVCNATYVRWCRPAADPTAASGHAYDKESSQGPGNFATFLQNLFSTSWGCPPVRKIFVATSDRSERDGRENSASTILYRPYERRSKLAVCLLTCLRIQFLSQIPPSDKCVKT